ncbi:dihydrofolate reductase family protein [Actinoplanes sp. NPDC051343]|jgi:dihydrofolate reductase|uniref:dihydrofolate reductase family protein n=1 Tax=Actinoplanes sp. NPDC051343 TaxID=3363906 RepID=UPI0037B69D7B
MPKTQYYTATSIDGFIADEQNSLEWLMDVDGGNKNPFGGFFAGVGAFCMGANTYEWVLENDNVLAEPQNWHDLYGDVPCWVFGSRELPLVPDANIFMVSGDVQRVHEAMVVAAKGKNVWLAGGGDLVGQFVDHGLLDEIIIGIAPVLLGAGVPLLPRHLSSQELILTGAAPVGRFAYLTYAVGTIAGLRHHPSTARPSKQHAIIGR